eukprot:SAG25_NODE_10683_length_325_cov_1.141593_1_plen_76_part_01
MLRLNGQAVEVESPLPQVVYAVAARYTAATSAEGIGAAEEEAAEADLDAALQALAPLLANRKAARATEAAAMQEDQ